ncbi:MAG TPA: endonuclease/exonuclease/phosphatase family protein [Alphaproteobacteria bacterium]|nr:endonuclease/exonuclease/phosphatase family protein [Alphaproteobacteria bacterium]
MTVATWNIHGCFGPDGRCEPERVVAGLKEIDADIVALQEVGWLPFLGKSGESAVMAQLSYLAAAAGYEARMPAAADGGRFTNAVLSRFPLGEHRAIDLTQPGRQLRGALDVDVAVGGQAVRVIAAHLGLRAPERSRQIAEVIARLEAGPPMPTLFLGDFNEWLPDSPRLKRLRRHFSECATARSFPSRMPALQLDRIYMTREFELAEVRLLRTAVTSQASDHLPVRATITLPTSAAPTAPTPAP